jgi:hypothetical protein
MRRVADPGDIGAAERAAQRWGAATATSAAKVVVEEYPNPEATTLVPRVSAPDEARRARQARRLRGITKRDAINEAAARFRSVARLCEAVVEHRVQPTGELRQAIAATSAVGCEWFREALHLRELRKRATS